MAGALQSLSTPPAPDPAGQQQGVLTSGAPQTQGAAPGAQQQGQPQQPPAPNNAQTVAALRHFSAIGNLLESALKDPDVGKSDLKDKVIDGVTQLVADRIMPAAQAVTELATFPEQPFQQRAWLQKHLMAISQARSALLTHHAMAFAGAPAEPTPSNDSHMQDLSGMMQAHYGARNG